jgi:hypothetical protein
MRPRVCESGLPISVRKDGTDCNEFMTEPS